MTTETALHSRESIILGVYPHPDDESFGMNGLITGGIDAKMSGDETMPLRFHSMHITAGEASTVYGSAGEDYVRNGNRSQEAVDALDYMGVPDHQRKFLEGFKDSHLLDSVVEISYEIRRYIEENEISDVVTLGAEGMDGQTDHIASFFAAKLAVASINRENRPRLWSLNTTDNDYDAEFVVCENDKIAAILKHWSQFKKEKQVWDAGSGMDETGEINKRYKRLLRAEYYNLIKVGTIEEVEIEFWDWYQDNSSQDSEHHELHDRELVYAN